MTKGVTLLRFADLKDRGVVRNRQQLSVLIHDHGFPPGFLLTPNTRVYESDAVDEWVNSRKARTEHRQQAAA